MNKRIVIHSIGVILLTIGAIMLLPLVTAMLAHDASKDKLAFGITIAALVVVGSAMMFVRTPDRSIYAKESIIIVGLSWIIITLFGALPLIISGTVPNVIDAILEMSSGFTTTGFSIFTDSMYANAGKGMMLWRSLSHWIGGMGILVFIVAVMPSTNASAFNLIKSESPGPQVSKLVSKVKFTAQILYTIYIAFTVIMIVMLLLGGVDIFDSLIITFGTVSTGGFAMTSQSIAAYGSLYVETVVTIFMFLCGINFNIFYLIIIGKATTALKSEEVRAYLVLIVLSIAAITVNIMRTCGGFANALRYSFFTVISVITSTGYTNYAITTSNFPPLAQAIIILLMFIGACAGSTGGGYKISRALIMTKYSFVKSNSILNGRKIQFIHMDGKRVDDNTIAECSAMFTLYLSLVVIGVIIMTASGLDFITGVSTAFSSLSNIGVAFQSVPLSDFNVVSKIYITIAMLMGRLEIFPILLLFNRHTFSRLR